MYAKIYLFFQNTIVLQLWEDEAKDDNSRETIWRHHAPRAPEHWSRAIRSPLTSGTVLCCCTNTDHFTPFGTLCLESSINHTLEALIVNSSLPELEEGPGICCSCTLAFGKLIIWDWDDIKCVPFFSTYVISKRTCCCALSEDLNCHVDSLILFIFIMRFG